VYSNLKGEITVAYDNDDPELLTITPSEIPIDSLAPALAEYETAISTVMSVPSKSDLVLTNVYEALNEKYNLNITNKEFTDFVSTITDKTKFESSIEKVIGGKIISQVCNRVTLKSIVSAGALIEKSLDIIEKQSTTINSTSAELIIMITKIFEWIEKLDDLKDKYESEGPDKTLERVLETKDGEGSGKAIGDAGSEAKNSAKIIKEILEGLKS
jgi:hypothetical protein